MINKEKETQIIYFPGYGSDSSSDTCKKINDEFGHTMCIKYDNVDPVKAEEQIIEQMNNIISKYHDPFIVGSSLGGYWANYAACKYKLPVVLINPSLKPRKTLGKYGVDEKFLKKYKKSLDIQISRSVFLGKNDDVVDPSIADKTFKNNSKIIWLNEGHRLNDFSPVIVELKYQLNNIQDF